MNLSERRYCLMCRQLIRHNEEVSVLANVLLAHTACIGGNRG